VGHVVDRLEVAEAVAGTRVRQQVRALDIDSMPPATTMLAEPALIRSWPSMMVFMPEPHTLLRVVAPVDSGMPAAIAAWRAGAWPRLAGSTQPMRTSETSLAGTPDCSRAAAMAAAPRVGSARR
jgi:hypothetical protein